MLSDTSIKAELEGLEAKGLARKLKLRDGSNLINFSSNDYLGLSNHPEVLKKTKEALDRYGLGGASSRLLAGTTLPHQELEQDLAKFLSKEAALVFSSGYHANTGLIPALVSAQDVVFFDRLSHASIIDGVRLSGAVISPFDHNDMDDLKARLSKSRSKGRRALVITEGFFSMDGDQPPLKEVVTLAHDADALVYLDEAHSIGMIGPDGKGLAAELGLSQEIDVHVGTLSKTLGSQGGFVAGSSDLVKLLISKCRSFLYTTALAPALAAGAKAALALVPAMQTRRDQVWEISNDVRAELKTQGYDTLQSSSPIIPVLTKTLEATKLLSDYLLEREFFVPSIRPPTVPIGEARVRLSISYPVIEHVGPLLEAFKGEKIVQAR